MKCIEDDLHLDISNCRGQAYDGAGSVAGKNKGLATLVRQVNSKALYLHCFSHVLNLVVQKSCGVKGVRDMLAEVKEICYFFKFSQGRLKFLEESINRLGEKEDKKKRLKDVCRTRWVDRIKGLSQFEELFVSIVDSLETMNLNVDKRISNENSGKAGNHFKALTNFEFIVSLVITRSVFDITLPVTQLLQSKSLDIYNGISMITALKNSLKAHLRSVESKHKEWYSIVLKLAERVNVVESKPRLCGRQVFRDNVQSDTVSEYYRRTVTQPLLEYMVTEISDRFEKCSMIPFYGLAIIPVHLFTLKRDNKNWKEDFIQFANFYCDDMPNISALNAELDLWERYWCLQTSKPDTVANTLKMMPVGFENIKVGLLLLGTLPITSCSCERSFSAMRRLKEYARSTMGGERLNGLALLYIHKEIIPNFDTVIDAFSDGNRRLDF
jgi:hypothetical protein